MIVTQLYLDGRAGLRGRGNGGNGPGPSAQRGLPWWQIFVLNKILVWKTVIHKRYKNTNPYSDVALSISLRSNYRPAGRMWPACGPPQCFQWLAEAFRKNLKIWNLFKNVWGYICFTESLALDKVHLHKNNAFLSKTLFYLLVLRSNWMAWPPLPLRWGTCLDNLCIFSVPQRWLSWRVHLAQWTQ